MNWLRCAIHTDKYMQTYCIVLWMQGLIMSGWLVYILYDKVLDFKISWPKLNTSFINVMMNTKQVKYFYYPIIYIFVRYYWCILKRFLKLFYIHYFLYDIINEILISFLWFYERFLKSFYGSILKFDCLKIPLLQSLMLGDYFHCWMILNYNVNIILLLFASQIDFWIIFRNYMFYMTSLNRHLTFSLKVFFNIF